jgi:putative membrane protein
MTIAAFYEDSARERVRSVVERVEAQTSAELVVSVVPRSGHYRHTDYLLGFVFAFGSLLLFLFHSRPLRSDLYPLEMLAAFALGALASAFAPPIRRLLTRRALMRDNVRRTARAEFVELGVSKTRDRSGVLVLVSTFERDAALVLDVGLDPAPLGERWAAAEQRVRDAVAHGDFSAFVDALEALGPLLAEICPRRDDDINELDDAPRLA